MSSSTRLHGVTVILYLTAKHQLRRFGGGGAAVGPLSKVDLAEEMRKRKERAKKFGLPVPVFAAEVRQPSRAPGSMLALRRVSCGEPHVPRGATTSAQAPTA